ncbi:ABC transporter ATP-binding protein [Beijerinckia sp. L45]|uniref:ABC transporter ATP-binding protein n=1 Tax=Beijerinckia sp. L45 TaxID=1641855 RepID=UPI00131BCC3E|nr:ABC transporter ATP-binding protein [Beijerinckia sp. L45]
MTVPLLSVENLCKAYGALRVTDRVTLTVAAGELRAIIGPNGAGKTTLIHQLSGLAAPDSGQVMFDGRDVTALSMPQRARLGLVRSFQITAILPRLSALDNVALAVQARSGSSFRFFRDVSQDAAINTEALALLARFRLDARAASAAGTLSYGEKRQLELAVALATRPKLLLLDEPLAGTSHDEARLVIAALQSLKRDVAIILIEHDMDAVFALADRVSVLVYGAIIASGTPAEIRADPAVRAAYLGEEA